MNLLEKLKYQLSTGHSAIYRLLLIQGGVFLFSIFVTLIAFFWQANPMVLLKYFYLPADPGAFMMRPWTLLTYMFFHSGFWHILSNALWLYFIGNILNDFLPNRRIYQIFIGGGLFGGLLYIISFNLFPVFSNAIDQSVLLGASGGVLAVVVGAATLTPNYAIRPFNLFNISLKWIALISVLIDLISIPRGNSGGHIAHIGGALFGFLFIRYIQGNITSFNFRWPQWFRTVSSKPDEKQFAKQYRQNRTFAGEKAAYEKPRQEEVDAILDKISQSGYDSLSKEEKDLLFRASE
jgi:membrane associated rhomboid family serine protease